MVAKLSCPICGKPKQEKFRPFCSERCKMIDLGRWLGGDYAIPDAQAVPVVVEDVEEEEE